ncbi:hypothetical protein SEA_TYPHA_10 [Mycobacterium phage Typha]|uniref:Uncharacterized protein n=1 Tax=Mycobacterium phage Typha TaxID=2517971 RepID=A0A482J6M7_9CAUD|nr:hypothetical protein KCH40_gp010 [Mycobacterium phage Typha]QBP29667.1 hypothetical protein SEA_TYPHA_10 [Mycobacterium phage Typha]URM86454.1 membrane protein [Mycobacterium phage Hilltopfarm]
MNHRGIASAAIQLAGVVAIMAGCWVLAPWLGLVVGGLLLVVVGLAIDPPARKAKQPAPMGDVL